MAIQCWADLAVDFVSHSSAKTATGYHTAALQIVSLGGKVARIPQAEYQAQRQLARSFSRRRSFHRPGVDPVPTFRPIPAAYSIVEATAKRRIPAMYEWGDIHEPAG